MEYVYNYLNDSSNPYYSGIFPSAPEGKERFDTITVRENDKVNHIPMKYKFVKYLSSKPFPTDYFHGGVESIVIGDEFNHSLDALQVCTNLRQLTLGNKFNQSLIPLEHLTKIKRLIIGDSFDREIPVDNSNNDHYLTSLTYLSIGNSFNKSICALPYMTRLSTLILGNSFNKSIFVLKYCTLLNTIKLGNSFNQDISMLSGLPNLIELYLGNNYNHSVDRLSCHSLQLIQFGDSFAHSLNELMHNCPSLKYLYVSKSYPFNIENIPDGVKVLYA
jgi:hypothetical protein